MPMLHVTNGDAAARSLAKAGVDNVLSWRDVLHEGPVPNTANEEELCGIRGAFLAECGWGENGSISADLRNRNAALHAAGEVTLWFEHDLYDQLQLVQILAMLDGRPASLAQASVFIGPMQAAEVHALAASARPVTPEQYLVAKRTWDAFRSPDAEAIPALLRNELSCLPHLRSAFGRLLEERPGTMDGLSRTERQILQVVATGPSSFTDLFLRTQSMEEAAFAGDSFIMLNLNRLASCEMPLLRTATWRLTEAGQSVLDGASNHMQLNRVDRWLGGMRLMS